MNMIKNSKTVGTVKRERYTFSRRKLNDKENKIDFKSKSKSIYFVIHKINGFILAFCVKYKSLDGTMKWIKIVL